ncbi:MAG TPA: hypothetical protein VMV06_09215 [Acidimicrobiales bacterium]|nr:hypothetical protein [Acidimicrobiales bacterium]
MRRWSGPVLAMILMLALPTSAGAAGAQFVHVNFVDQARMVTLTVPTPACRPGDRATSCVWELFVDEPDVPGQPVVGAVSGTSGVLSVPYPTTCGVLQADALVGSPLRKAVGYRHVISTCRCAPLHSPGLSRPTGNSPVRPQTPEVHARAAESQFVHVKFVDQSRAVTLTIPTPACKHSSRATSCVWRLFVDEPDVAGQPVVGAVSGTSGVLSVPYPTMCGVLQADALVGAPPRKAVGYRHVINACGCGGN